MHFNPSRASGKGVLSRSVPLLAPRSPYTYLPISLATGSETYLADIAHSQSSAEQNSTCAVNPSSVDDLSTIIKIIGRDDIRAPFAIKSGGHPFNQGFSSTTGVQISMANFTSVIYNEAAGTVSFGSGRTWDQIYTILEKDNVTVAGGRVPGVGVGLVLLGGYSFFANQYGLGVDNVVSYDLVLPNGTFVTVSDTNHPELVFGLKGGSNNFGIVSGFTMYTRPLGAVWGGLITYAPSDAISQALSDFNFYNTDKKAQVVAGYVQTGLDTATWEMLLFYDGGFQPAVFQPFLDIPALASNVSVRTLTDLLATNNPIPIKSGGFSSTTPISKFPLPIITEIQQQVNATYQQALISNRSVLAVQASLEPFLGAFDFETPSAYPHPPSQNATHCTTFVAFSDLADTEYFLGALRDLSDAVQGFAVEQGESRWDGIRSPNFALGDTPLELLYGENVPKLRRIARKVDPEDIMGLTGGFKF
ncbi:hypothetical protein K443DRAFT_102120 [Laccaria amethystina LaAM-08-1]|uniref:FAD-binding PCMH-type domain-containing protein n=1 Tax=Laccaria amethystina LaAM-08-1 TaxID=1095629 RepID=A0A0C9XPK6_9AGAR|nr:hypothetical protein K443DRAFT_102120 [Laccaria amethystina LaAM-08-1]